MSLEELVTGIGQIAPFGETRPLSFIISGVLIACMLAIALSVAVRLLSVGSRLTLQRSGVSVVATSTMTLFLIGYFIAISMQIGQFQLHLESAQLIIIGVALLMIVVGTIVNVIARNQLGRQWANQIKIFPDHRLQRQGFYRIVRHPLYSSLICIFLGFSLLFANLLAFLLTIGIFIPLMYVRARQEEKLLLNAFPEYRTYMRRVPMFFPQLLKVH